MVNCKRCKYLHCFAMYAEDVVAYGCDRYQEMLDSYLMPLDECTKLDDGTSYEVEGHVGKWHVIESTKVLGREVYLMEHDTYGSDAANIVVDEALTVLMEESYDGLNDETLEVVAASILEEYAVLQKEQGEQNLACPGCGLNGRKFRDHFYDLGDIRVCTECSENGIEYIPLNLWRLEYELQWK